MILHNILVLLKYYQFSYIKIKNIKLFFILKPIYTQNNSQKYRLFIKVF